MIIFCDSDYFHAMASQLFFLCIFPDYLEQWFSEGGDFGPRGHLAMSRDSFGCHNWGSAAGM